jgi:tetratricopeptide (TPR) repeat protein
MSDSDQPSAGASSIQNQSGGVNVKAKHVGIGGDVVGRDKIEQTITYEAPAPIATSLHQLPPPPRDFTDREVELAELMAKAETDGLTISGLQGMGGVGKTALALVLAERLKPRYPDAQFYLDLKGADKQPLSVAAALTHVIRAYQPTAKLPESEAELRGLYFSVLEGQRVLLLMDNAIDKTQIESLIPPSSCFLLVTSRQHFTLPGLYATDLNMLPPNEARDLLLKIAPRIDGQADALAKLCGYLPLALRLAGSALAERRTLTPEAYVKRLEDAQTRLELVEASLSLGYGLLSEELQRAWCALAVFPDTFDLAAAAAVWDVEENLAQDRLDELVRYCLADWNEASARVRLHDLARLIANKRLGDSERMKSQRQHAAHYREVSATANTLYQQGGERLIQGLALFDLERTNIETGQTWAVTHATEDGEAAESCIWNAWQWPILSLRLHPREYIRWADAALSAARRLGNRQAEGGLLLILGLAYDDLGEYRRAIECHEQALAIDQELSAASRSDAERMAARQGEGADLCNLGLVYDHLGEHRRAIEYHEQALTIHRENCDQQNEGETLGNLGNDYAALGEYRRAIDYHEQSLAIARERSDRRNEGETLGNLGNDYAALGEYRRAIEYHEQSFAIAREIHNQRGEAHSLWGLARCLDTADDRPQAIAYAQAALDIFTAIESPHAQEVRDLLAKWFA